MWELDHKEGWGLKNWCFLIVALEKSLESPLDSKEIKPVNPKGNQSWIFIGRTDTEAEALILWLPDAKSWHIGKDLDSGKDWGQEDKSVTGWDGWMASVPSLHGKQKGKKWKQWPILFSSEPKSLWMVTATMKLKDACSLEGKSWPT